MTLNAARSSASLTADLLGFSQHHNRPPQRITQEGIKIKKKKIASCSVAEETALVMSRVGGQKGQTLVGGQTTVTSSYNQGEHHLIHNHSTYGYFYIYMALY